MFRRQNNPYKAHRTLILLGVMCLIGLFLINLVSGTTYLEDVFNRADSDTVGNGWVEIENTGTVRIDNNMMNLTDTEASYVAAKNNFSTQTNDFRIDFEIYPTKDNNFIALYFGTEANYNAISVYLNHTGSVMYRDSVGEQSPTVPTTYQGNKWYNISVRPNTNTNTFDLYFNDTLICDACDFRVEETGINWTEFSSITFAIEEFYIDNVEVGNGTTEASVNVTLNSPINRQGFSVSDVYFNASYTSENSNLTSATYYIWNNTGIYNTTTIHINGTSNSSSLLISDFGLGTYTWNVKGCVTAGNCSFAESNYTFTIGASIINKEYSLSTYETQNERFETNISIISGYSLHSSYLIYNNTRYVASINTISSNASNIYKTIDIPVINGSTTNSFFWSFTLTQTDGTQFYQNTSLDYQNISYINLINCNSTWATKTLNFTTKSATNPLPLVNTTFYSNWYYWLGRGSTRKQYSWENTSELNSNYQFCINPNFTYSVSADIEYDSTGYSKNYYYLDNASINNQTQSINFYLLNDSIATLTVLQVIDQYQNEQPGIIIQIQQYDIGLGTYFTIGMSKTSSSGEDITYLNWYDTFYKFILIKNNTIVQISDPMKIKASTVTFTLSDEFEFDYDKFDDITYTLYYNNATSNFILTFADSSGSITQGCLRVIRRHANAETIICDSCEESASATLYCNINTNLSGTYFATFYAKGSPIRVFASISKKAGTTISQIYDSIENLSGSFLALIMAGVVVGLFLFSPVLAIVAVIGGLLIAISIGFTTVNYVTFIGLVIAGGIVAWAIQS